MVGRALSEENIMTAGSAVWNSAASASHILGRKLDSIPLSAYRVVLIVVLRFVRFIEAVDLALSRAILQAESSACRGYDPTARNPGRPQ